MNGLFMPIVIALGSGLADDVQLGQLGGVERRPTSPSSRCSRGELALVDADRRAEEHQAHGALVEQPRQSP